MTLAPRVTATLGNLVYHQQVIGLSISLTMLPGVSTARIQLPVQVRLDALPGDDVQLELDSGDTSAKVLTGQVFRVQRGLHYVTVIAADGAHQLGRTRTGSTYQEPDTGAVVRSLASAAGVEVGSVDLSMGLAAYVAYQGLTAAEHIASLARLGGAFAAFDANGMLNVRTRPTGNPDLALRYGRELMEYQTAEVDTVSMPHTVVGSGPAGTAQSPDALLHTTRAIPSSAPAPAEGIREPVHFLRIPEAASGASEAVNTGAAARLKRVRGEAFLLPQLRPGMVLQVQEAPNGGDPWFITHVTHRFSRSTPGRTVFEGVAAEAGSLLGSLAGSALSAVGGLL